MVIRAVLFAFAWTLLLAEQKDPVIERLDPLRRAAVIMALLALVLVGLLLVTCIMIGGHWVRRMARHRPGTRANDADAAAENRRLRGALQSVLPDEKTSDTIQLGKSPSDTKIE